jgi:NitT/TauT family transport system permease protein
MLSPIFFPAPSTILVTLVRLVAHDGLVSDVMATLMRVLLGFLLGGVPGLLLGFAMGWSGRLRSALDPVVAAVHPIPKIAVFPLIMIFFGIGETSRLVTVAIATLFPMVISTMAGVRQISPTYYEVAENYGAGPGKVLTRIIVPGSLPMILSGGRISVNIALLVTIAVELVASRNGLGAVIWLTWETLRTEELYASLMVISVIGIAFNALLQGATKALVPWEQQAYVR